MIWKGGLDPEAVLDLLPDGVVCADSQGLVTGLNAAAERLLGADGAACVGAPLAEVVTLADQEGNDWFSCNNPYGGFPLRNGLTEQSWFLPDGTELLLTARIARERPAGPVAGVVVSLRTARGRARLDRERSDLVATVAHELRSPLTGVKGFAATLLSKWDRLTDDQKRLMLETVNADADRLARLIAELLDVARIDTGRLSLLTRPVDLRNAVERVLQNLRAGTGRRIEVNVPTGLPAVNVDPDKFSQVLTNLVENALRHGEGDVRISAEPPDGAPPGFVALHIDDAGGGIAPDLRTRVFTKFWKHGSSGGSGIGMYVVQGLVRAHGGTVEIHDSPEGGARVSVHWPVAGDEA